MKIYRAIKQYKYLWQIFTLFVIMGINARHALAVIPHEISVGCPGTTVPPAPSDLMRIKGDSEPWSFVIKPEPGVTIDHQVWTYRSKDGSEPNWGNFSGGDGTNGLTWSSPNIADHFTIDVKAKRHCAGGGTGDDNFEITWGEMSSVCLLSGMALTSLNLKIIRKALRLEK